MQFTVPKFIEHESKIIGPLTFKQFIYLGVAGGISFVLYLTIPLAQCIIIASILMGGAGSLAFVKVEGRSLPILIKDFLFFSSSPKLYIWEKKGLPPKYLREEKKLKPEKKKTEVSGLTITGGRLGQLSTQLETKTK